MAILVIAEHDGLNMNAATRAAVTAAQQMQRALVASQQNDKDIHLLLAGESLDAVSKQACTISGVTKVLTLEDARFSHALAEPMAALIAAIAQHYSHVVMAATSIGKDIMPRASALLDAQQISEITQVVDAYTFVRPIYAGNALETVKSLQKLIVVTVRATAFDKAGIQEQATPIEAISLADVSLASIAHSRFIAKQGSDSTRPELASARIVISGGRGLGSKENFALIERLADKLGAAIGASRAAVDAGYVPNDYQVGQTGKVVAPELYIAIGISGAIQHLAGMKESKIIVAINKDENAPIFEIADYGLVGDLFEILPQLEAAL